MTIRQPLSLRLTNALFAILKGPRLAMHVFLLYNAWDFNNLFIRGFFPLLEIVTTLGEEL